MNYTFATGCRSCGGSLSTVLDLGTMHLNAFPLPGEKDTEKTPLCLAVCKACMLVQLRHTVNPDLLFREFWYRSSVTQTMRDAMRDLVDSAYKHADMRTDDMVIDIASNDGTLLRCWGKQFGRIGFDPALNLADEASEGGNTIITDYFSAAALQKVTQQKAKVITCAAMFYDVDAPNQFLKDVKACLTADGVFICQLSYLPAMLDTNDFPSICQEHLCYYSLTSLVPMFVRNGLRVFDVEFNNVNGGSVRVFADHGWRDVQCRVDVALSEERRQDIASYRAYDNFGLRVVDDRTKVQHLLYKFALQGPVYLLGASTKGQILAQYYGLNTKLIAGVSERDPRKIGREMVGNRIPIVSEEDARKHAKTMLVLPWPFAKEIQEREASWLTAGGRLVFAQPRVYVVEGKPCS